MYNFIVNNLNYEIISHFSIVLSIAMMIYFSNFLGSDMRKALPAKVNIFISAVFFASIPLYFVFYLFAFSVAGDQVLSNLDVCRKERLSSQLSTHEVLLNKDVMESSSYCDAKRLKFENELRSGKTIESQINLIKSSEVKK